MAECMLLQCMKLEILQIHTYRRWKKDEIRHSCAYRLAAETLIIHFSQSAESAENKIKIILSLN